MRNRISLILLLFITTIIVTEITLSRYYTAYGNDDVTKVARWENNIEIIDDLEVELENKKNNSKGIRFNVNSNSEVTSEVDIIFENIHKDIGISLQNDYLKNKCMLKDGNLFVSFLTNDIEYAANFDINGINNQFVELDGINFMYTSNEESDGKRIIITNDSNDMYFEVFIRKNSDLINITFGKFSKIEIGEYNKEYTVFFETEEIDLVSNNDILFYATFTQVN